jgi:SAM-dependent methyltransferase
MTFPDTNFDIILCSNVLEHIKNDVKAISEIYRVLKPGGFALILVPIGGEKTFEDPTIPPEKCAEYYGCAHHVRLYGLDIKEKLTLLGFKVKIEYFGNNLSQNLIEKYGLNRNEIFFVALK